MFSEPIERKSVKVDLFDTSADVEVCLTESGSINTNIPEKVAIDPDEDVNDFFGKNEPKLYKFNGETDSGVSVEFQKTILGTNITLGPNGGLFVKEMSPAIMVFNSSENFPIVNSKVTVEFDFLCLKPTIPFIERSEPVTLLERDGWSISAESLEDREERVDLIKEYRRPLRTATLEVTQEVSGPPCIQVERALDTLGDIIELLSFVQGVKPCPFRARVTRIDGQETDFRYEKWITNYSKAVGHAFVGPRIVWSSDITQFLDEAYDDYAEGSRDRYRLNMVINWYLDALNNTRTIDAKFASICSGIELLAKRYSDLGPEHSATEDRIKHLVNELGVEVRDLAEFAGSFENSKLDDDEYANEYFHYQARQYVMHGDNLRIPSNGLFKDYEAGIRYFQRLLRNQLVDPGDLDKYSSLSELMPEDNRYK
ncbi:hypothetical protein [Natronosalvus halobius]|uniref:hypothetical protein n=1 Tax=Natronosalvus halobius TaxID=2953746 RepID=UPI00209FC702|nr:hypothetical protein [Natronosalvus halobius]USZ71257.1 hypothetical protein NGM15_14405 [Natronosalvus halobius]